MFSENFIKFYQQGPKLCTFKFNKQNSNFPTCKKIHFYFLLYFTIRQKHEKLIWVKCCSSKLMFKMPVISLNTCSKVISPFIDCTINNALIKTITFLHKSLFEMVNIEYAGLINTCLKDAPYFVIDWIEIRAIGGPKSGWNKIWSFSWKQIHSFSGSVSWSTVLLKNSLPNNSLIAGNKCSPSKMSW